MFPEKVLLAVDGSLESGLAARMAAGLTKAMGSELHVVFVGPVEGPYSVPEATLYDPEYDRRVRERAEPRARTRLAEEVGKLEEAGAEVAGAHARVGRPDAEIVGLADEIGAGMVALGSRGLGPLRRAVLGSVSASVIHHAHGSVLVVRDHGGGASQGDGDFLPGRILLAVDGSEEAARAAEMAAEISEKTGSELHLVYALQTEAQLLYPHPMGAQIEHGYLEEAREDARAFVDGQTERMRSDGVEVAEAHLSLGKPDDEIVALAEEMGAGLVVVGSRGLGGVRRALMGSVSDSVVRHAHCPVLVVRREGA